MTIPTSQTTRPSGGIFQLTFGFTLVLLLLVIGLLIWANNCTLEESVPGFGELVPEIKETVVRASTRGLVIQLLANEQESVKAGQVLVQLDPKPYESSQAATQSQLSGLNANVDALRSAAFHQRVRPTTASGAWANANMADFEAQRLSVQHRIEQSKHDLEQSLTRQRLLAQELATLKSRNERYQSLFDEGGLSKVELDQYNLDALEKQRMLDETASEIASKRAALQQATQGLNQIQTAYEKEVFARMTDVEQSVLQVNKELVQTATSKEYTTIKAPTSGRVNQQAIHGPGVFVEAGDTLLTLVPETLPIHAEIKVTNQDLSYIHLRQRAALRVDAFPYQKFGRLMGTVTAISPSSQKDDKGNSLYKLTITLDEQCLRTKEKCHPLRPGMTLSTDLITRKKTLLSFITEPLQMKLDKAFRDPSGR
jgi:HlyD family type I secretion membrane fusion protein